jgi:hypothetical protein
MTSTLNSASTDRMLHRFATRRPEWFAVLTCLAYGLPLTVLVAFNEQEPSFTASPLLLAMIAWCVLAPAVLLTALGWWGLTGFTRGSTWRNLVPFLPLILLFVVLPLLGLVFGPGVTSHGPGYFTLAALTMLAVGFGQEAIFRGVVLQTLLPRGYLRAVLLSSGLYGVANIGTLASDRDPVLVGVQFLAAVGIGVAFAAVVVVTGTIWPLVVISAASFFANTVPYGDNPPPTDSGTLAGSLIVGALAAAYGIWLLHRDQHRPAAHSGEGVRTRRSAARRG